jgi:serine/threonine protein kinase
VYKAKDSELGRIVAIKVIRGSGAFNRKQLERFLQEIKTTASLQHPNIVGIYDFGEQPQHYFTMEYVSGKTLTEIIREGTLKSKKTAQILKSICEGIGCAHSAKVIHRDLKPSNVMIDTKGNVKIMDFGLAKFLESEDGLSRTGDVLGTPMYMPPEQAQAKNVDERSDIYAVGAIGYEMLTGRPIFEGDNLFKILHQVIHIEPTRPSSIHVGIHLDLETIVLKCLEKMPEKRYQTIQELQDDIQRYLECKPILAKPPSTFTRVKKWILRNKEITTAIASILLAIVFVFTYVVYEWDQQTKYNQTLNMLQDIARWDKSKVSNEEMEQAFSEICQFHPSFIVYREWGYYFMEYALSLCCQNGLKKETAWEEHYHKAIEKFKKAIELNPDDYVSMYYLYMIYTSLDKEKVAQNYSSQILDIAKKIKAQKKSSLEKKFQNEFGWVVDAIECREMAKELTGKEKQEKLSQAIECLKSALRYNPKLFCSYNALGEVYAELGLYTEAKKSFEESLKLAPNYQTARRNLESLKFKKP